MTKDERLLIEIYREILRSKEDCVHFAYLIKSLGYKEHLVKNILKGLMQANLVRKVGEDVFGLTDRGLEVAASLEKK